MDKIEDEFSMFEKNLVLGYFYLKEFQFESGAVLKDLKVEYTTIGNKILNKNGEITNVVLYFHGLGENCLDISKIQDIIGKNKSLDTDKFFIISITTLGSPNSHSPSNSSLKNKFPSYTIKDMINFHKEFLESKFKIKHVKGLIGYSMGGFESLEWGTLYPDYMDFIISIASSYKISSESYILLKLVNQIIEKDPDYNDGDYENPLKSVGIANQLVFPFSLSQKFYNQFISNEEIDKQLAILKNAFSEYDGNDVILRGNAVSKYNVENKLENIIAKTLIVAINQDLFFPPEFNAVPMNKLIKESKLVFFDSLFGHSGIKEIGKIENELKSFLAGF